MKWFTSRKKSEEASAVERMEAKIESVVRGVMERALRDTESMISRLHHSFDLEGVIASLREEIETLRIEKGRKKEEQERLVREVEHKVGLERQRQEFEVDQARREAELELKEKFLKKEKQRFEEQMQFHKEAMRAEVDRLQTTVEKLMERLPSAEIIANLGGSKGD